MSSTTAQRLERFLAAALDITPAPAGAGPSALSMASSIVAAEINAYRARIAELEGLLREAMPMLKGAADLKAAVDELARDLPV